jgi:transcription elongation factor GreA
MTEDRVKSGDAEPLADAIPWARTGRPVFTSAEYAALAQELELLRSRHRAELEERLRVARGFGVSSDNDDLLAVMEDAAVDEPRIAQLEDELRTARVVDADYTRAGTAGLGATVGVVDEAGRHGEYQLVGRRTLDSGRAEVTPSSPVGEALMGARPGDEVRVEVPSGRVRVLRVLEVRYAGSAEAT